MRYLLVGSSGYIGSYLKSHLQNLGIHFLETSRENKALESNDLFFCDIDSEAYDQLDKLSGVQGLIFLAWPNLDRTERDSDTHLEFRLKAQKFIKTLMDSGIKRIIISGTCEEYGLQEGKCEEFQSITPVSQYGVQKNEFHKWLEGEVINKNLQLLWLRFFYLYGENPNRNTLFQEIIRAESQGELLFNLSTSGNQCRDYLHVNDATRIAAKLLVHESIFGTINIGSGISTSLKSLVSSWKEQNDWKIEFTFRENVFPLNEPKVQFADISKLNLLQ